jgi:hypothetical protein
MCFGGLAIATGSLSAQTDPGPRPGPASAGSYYPTLNSSEQYFFNQAISRFTEVDSVPCVTLNLRSVAAVRV